MFARLPQEFVPILSAAVLVALLPACTPGSSSPDPAADSSAASSAAADPDSTVPDPSPPPAFEDGKDTRSVAQKLRDARTETRVKRTLVQTSELGGFPFRLTVVEGHLLLRGDVNTVDQYRQADRIARDVEGVEAVTNRLTMGGRPVTEERLDASEDPSESEDSAVYHTVRQGDTLWDVARKYRASVGQIRALNDLQSSSLRPGQRIRVR